MKKLLFIIIALIFLMPNAVAEISNYTYHDYTNNRAYNFTQGAGVNRWATGTEMTTQGYTNLQSKNLVNASCVGTSNNDYCLIRFVFDINETPASISSLNMTIWGGENGDDVGAIHIYDWTNNVWVNFANNLSITYGISTLNLTSSISNYIGANGNITIVIDDPAVLNDAGEYLFVDYIAVNVTYAPITDTCTYSSGNWALNCADACNFTTTQTIAGSNNITTYGTGTITFNNNGKWKFTGTGQYVNVNSGCTFVINSGGGWNY